MSTGDVYRRLERVEDTLREMRYALDAVRSLAEMALERASMNGGGSLGNQSGGSGVATFLVTSAIGAATGSGPVTPGSGTATLLTGTSLASTGKSYTIRNITERSPKVGATIHAEPDADGNFWFTTVDKCTNLS